METTLKPIKRPNRPPVFAEIFSLKALFYLATLAANKADNPANFDDSSITFKAHNAQFKF